MIMKKHNKLNTIWWTLFIAGVLSASASQKLVYSIAYKLAYDKAYDAAFQHGFEKRGHNWATFSGCIDFGLLDESEKAASQIASQKAQSAADRTLDAGAFMAVAGLIGLLAKKKSNEH